MPNHIFYRGTGDQGFYSSGFSGKHGAFRLRRKVFVVLPDGSEILAKPAVELGSEYGAQYALGFLKTKKSFFPRWEKRHRPPWRTLQSRRDARKPFLTIGLRTFKDFQRDVTVYRKEIKSIMKEIRKKRSISVEIAGERM